MKEYIKNKITPKFHAKDGFWLLKSRKMGISPAEGSGGILLVLLAIFSTSMRYEVNTGYLISFWLIATLLMASLITALQFSKMKITVDADDLYEAEALSSILIKIKTKTKHSIEVSAAKNTLPTKCIGKGSCEYLINIGVRDRGVYKAPDLKIQSTWPLNLWRFTGMLKRNESIFVYPKIDKVLMRKIIATGNIGSTRGLSRGQEEISGLKEYQQGEPLSRMHWKTYGRTQGQVKLTKVGSSGGETDSSIVRWEQLQDIEDLEGKLSFIATWISARNISGKSFGIDIPGLNFPEGKGNDHLHEALKTLAIYD